MEKLLIILAIVFINCNNYKISNRLHDLDEQKLNYIDSSLSTYDIYVHHIEVTEDSLYMDSLEERMSYFGLKYDSIQVLWSKAMDSLLNSTKK